MADRTTKAGNTTFPSFATKAIHSGYLWDEWPYKETVPPISIATTFKQSITSQPKKHDTINCGTANVHHLEKCLAVLEDAKYCRLFNSGKAAASALTACFLKAGDHVICTDDVYSGIRNFFTKIVCKNRIDFQLVDTTNVTNVEKAVKPNTKLVWIESPSSSLLNVTDIEQICKSVKKCNETIIVIVDNTLMSPYFQRPLELCADIVLHSITKYINGHMDILMGCVCTNDSTLDEQIKCYQLAAGLQPSPFDCYLVNRSVKTLHIRMERHMLNGLRVARFLEGDPHVLKVLYPELASHPQHLVHKKQTKGMSGMVSFYLDAHLQETIHFLKDLKYFTLAQSLGSFESLVVHPASMTHASMPKEERKKLGIQDNLIRMSVGLENVENLIEELSNAFKNMKK